MNEAARKIIETLTLAPLSGEGGFFRQTWESAQRGPEGRPVASAIYFLLTPVDFSALHRLRLAEVWSFHAGDPIQLTLLDPATGAAQRRVLGTDFAAGQFPQAVVSAGVWQGARTLPGSSVGWSLVTCVVAPAWDDRDFELGGREALLAAFPGERESIRTLTR